MTEEQSDYDILMEQAHDGADLEDFKNSNVGRYLYQRADVDEFNALRKLARVDPTDSGKIAELQVKAIGPALAIRWVEEAIIKGKQAKWELEQRRATE